jgi:hypothetical protein
MNTDINIADFVVHLHPESSGDNCGKIERDLRAMEGVVSVHFMAEEHPHAMVVAYNPIAVNSETLLTEIRKCDSEAVIASL